MCTSAGSRVQAAPAGLTHAGYVSALSLASYAFATRWNFFGASGFLFLSCSKWQAYRSLHGGDAPTCMADATDIRVACACWCVHMDTRWRFNTAVHRVQLPRELVVGHADRLGVGALLEPGSQDTCVKRCRHARSAHSAGLRRCAGLRCQSLCPLRTAAQSLHACQLQAKLSRNHCARCSRRQIG